MIAVPLAQLACQPVIILLNASLPTYGILANVLAEPAAPLATIIGLAGCTTPRWYRQWGAADPGGMASVAWIAG